MCLFTAKLHTDGTDGTPALMLTNAQQLDTNMHKNLEPEIKGTPCERTLLASVTSSLSLTDTHGHAHTHTHRYQENMNRMGKQCHSPGGLEISMR